ncbi:MAG: hypothetical protein ABIH87_01645 [bacterium]
MFIVIFQRLLLEAIADLLYFPIWWYGHGSVHAGQWCLGLFMDGNASLAPGLWLKNIFVPMFGQWDWRGRIISFFIRLINIIIRSIMLAVWLVFCMAILTAWLVIPLICIYSLTSIR